MILPPAMRQCRAVDLYQKKEELLASFPIQLDRLRHGICDRWKRSPRKDFRFELRLKKGPVFQEVFLSYSLLFSRGIFNSGFMTMTEMIALA
ncbi:hypothetical protein Q3G72_001637 [Acer saccharum]|nr:hypothetical protein Q3G72_001637 [Acer saccharum]